MKKEDILKSISDETQRNNVAALLDYAETQAKNAEMTAEKFRTMFEAQAKELKIEVKDINGLENQIEALGKEINNLKDKGKTAEFKSIYDSVHKMLTDNVEKLSAWKERKESFSFHIKNVGSMTISGNVTGDVPQAVRIPGVNEIPLRTPKFISTINQATTAGNKIEWVYEIAGEGGVGGTAESVKKNQIDADFAIGHEDVKKRTGFVRVSEEMLDDIDYMASYITNKLLSNRLLIDLDNQALNGDNLTTNLNGAYTQATAFDSGEDEHTITAPNEYDVICAAITQIAEANHTASHVAMTPRSMSRLRNAKDDFGQYVFPDLRSSAPMIAGLTPVETTAMTADSFMVYDSTKATVYYKEGIRVEMGYSGTDFEENMRTIRAEARLALVIETNDTTAFVKGTFAAAKLELQKENDA